VPDSDDGLSGLPENTPGNVGRLPCLQKETATNAGAFPSLPEDKPVNAGNFFARRNKEGNMGVGHVFGWFSQKGAGRYVFPYLLLRLLAGEVLENLQEMSRFKDWPFVLPDSLAILFCHSAIVSAVFTNV
jgi:hypothetical protein